jgi:putative endonuclease
MPHFVYIIYSDRYDVYYKGESDDTHSRLDAHNKDLSEYTKEKGPWRLVYIEECCDRKTALRREKQIKKLNRRSIDKLLRDPTNKLLC